MNYKYLKEQSRLNNTYRVCIICSARKNLKSYWGASETCKVCSGIDDADKSVNITTTELIEKAGIHLNTFYRIRREHPNIQPIKKGKSKAGRFYYLWDKQLIQIIKDIIKSENKGETW